MSDEPPRDEAPRDEPAEPPSPAPSDFDPTRPASASFAEIAGRGCLGVVAFLLATAVFMMLIATSQVVGIVISLAIVAGLILWRRKAGPSPLLGAVVVGAGIALAVTGTCTLILMNLNFG